MKLIEYNVWYLPNILFVIRYLNWNHLRPFSSKSEHFQNLTPPVIDFGKGRLTFDILAYISRTKRLVHLDSLTFLFLMVQALIWHIIQHDWSIFIFLSLYVLKFKMAAKRLTGKNGNNLIWIPEGQNYKVTTKNSSVGNF